MTWAVGIAQLTHHSVRNGGKIFYPQLEPRSELIAQYRPPMSFRYNIVLSVPYHNKN